MILSYIGGDISKEFEILNEEVIGKIEEIRIRIGKPALVYIKGAEYALKQGRLIGDRLSDGYKVNEADIRKTLELMSNYSLYAIKEEMKSGYITLPGGHRVGISGKIVAEEGRVKTFSYINGLNIRMSHEIIGCADNIMEYIGFPRISHTLIISPPGCGKTTLLRDIARQLSNGISGKLKGVTVGVVDERSEIAGSYLGIPQNDVGIRTDVLDGCPKAEGMIMFLRSMAPKVIIADEIGNEKDIYAIENILNCGVKIICTIHGYSLKDVLKKPNMQGLMERNIFERYIVLSCKNGIPGYISEIYNKDFSPMKDHGRHGTIHIESYEKEKVI